MEHLNAVVAPGARGAYSHGVAAGRLLFTAEMGPLDPATGEVIGSTVGDQTAQVIANLEEILRLRGRSLADVVKTTVHLADLGTFAELDAAYRQLMPEHYASRTTAGSTLAGILLEIDFVALA